MSKSKGRTFFFEVSTPALWEFGKYESGVMRRYWFGWFSIGWFKMSLDQLPERIGKWEDRNDLKKANDVSIVAPGGTICTPLETSSHEIDQITTTGNA